MPQGLLQRIANHPATSHVGELGGLGLLAAIPAYHLLRGGSREETPTERAGSHATDLAGLSLLAAPTILKLLANRH